MSEWKYLPGSSAPSQAVEVLVTIEDRDTMERMVTCAYQMPGRGWLYGGSAERIMDRVVAFMPMPEPAP